MLGLTRLSVRFKLGLVGSGHLYMSGYRLVQCLLWLKSCQRRSVYTTVSNKVRPVGFNYSMRTSVYLAVESYENEMC